MELFKLFGTIALHNSDANKGIDDTTSKAEAAKEKLGAAFDKIGGFAVKAGQTIAAGLAVGATAIAGLTKQSLDNYAEYEQLVGGVETLYGATADSMNAAIAKFGEGSEAVAQLASRQDTVLANASNAYKTAGMSANDYMNTVNGFAASLTSSLGEYENQAANYADMIVTDMSDNANKMGTSMDMIQNAYSGFAKQNYTMLDNLKLGYGGTKEEMERLLRDAEKFEGYIEGSLKIESFANVAEAINIIQREMGIAGTTAKEASSTIQGSVAMAKAAWSNLLTGMADETADLEELVNQFVESVGIAAENIIPRIEVALEGAAELIDRLFPIIIDKIPKIINNVLPKILNSAVSIVQNLVNGISQNQGTIMQTGFDMVMTIVNAITSMLPDILALGMELLVTVANGIVENLDELTDSAVEMVLKIVNTITDPATLGNLMDAALEVIFAMADALIECLPELVDAAVGIVRKIVEVVTDPETLERTLDAALEIILAIADGLLEFIPELIEAAMTIVTKLVEFILQSDNLTKLINAAFDLLEALATGMLDNIGLLTESAITLVEAIVESFKNMEWGQVGMAIVNGIGEGIINSWSNFVDNHPFVAEALVNGANAFRAGGSDALVGTLPSHASGLDYVPYDGYVAELHRGEMVVPAAESRILRSGGYGVANAEVIQMLERILYAVQESGTQNITLSVNNREFARMVKAVN